MLTIRTRRNDPFNLVGDLRRQLDWFFGADPFFSGLPVRAAAPRFSVRRDEAGLVLQADLPGLKKEDLSVSIEDGLVRISGGREIETPEGYRALRNERVAGSFERVYELPEDIDPEAADAKLSNGVFTLRFGLRPERQPRQIPITVG